MRQANADALSWALAGESVLGLIGTLRVGLIVFAIGLCLGGTTDFAINPARDLGQRILHAILPIRGKRDRRAELDPNAGNVYKVEPSRIAN